MTSNPRKHPIPPDREEKYLHLIARLPPHRAVDDLVSVFFADVNWIYSILEPCYFRAQVTSWHALQPSPRSKISVSALTRDTQYFPAAMFQVLAIALQFSPPDSDTLMSLGASDATARHRLSAAFSDAGAEIMDLLTRNDTSIAAVQCDFLRASWLKNCGRVNESWQSLGSAIR